MASLVTQQLAEGFAALETLTGQVCSPEIISSADLTDTFGLVRVEARGTALTTSPVALTSVVG